MNNKEGRTVSNGVAWVVICAMFVVTVAVGWIIYYTVKEGTFCAITAGILCWLALVGVMVKR